MAKERIQAEDRMIEDATAILEDPRLAEFLSDEASKVPGGIGHIRWKYDPSMDPTNPGMVSRDPDVITLNPKFDDAIQVRAAAHEITHLILDGQGFPGCKSPPGWKMVGPALSGLVMNPIIRCRLKHYGLVYTAAHWKDILSPLFEWLEGQEEPAGPSPRYYHWTFRDAEILLICPDGITKRLRSFHCHRFPNIGREAEKIAQFLVEEGEDHRDTAFANLLRIRATYNLQHVGLRIVDGVTGRYF